MIHNIIFFFHVKPNFYYLVKIARSSYGILAENIIHSVLVCMPNTLSFVSEMNRAKNIM